MPRGIARGRGKGERQSETADSLPFSRYGAGVNRFLIALAAGFLSATGFAPLGLWPLTLAGLAVLLALVMRAPDWKAAARIGWGFGIGHFVLGLNWIATAFSYQDAMPVWLGWVAVVLLSLFLALYPAIATGLAWRFGRGEPLRFALLFAVAWMVSEWVRGWLFTGFPWNPLGVVLIDQAWLGLAPWIGTLGLSGLAALIPGVILWLVETRRWRSLAGTMTGLAAIALLPDPSAIAAPANDPVRLHVVQPNIGQQDKWREGYEGQNFIRLAKLSGRPGGAPRLLLWPEAALPDYLEEDPLARTRVAALLGPEDIVLTGGVALESDQTGKVAGARNSVFAMDSHGRILTRYDKAHLVPYGEYLPMRPLLSAIGLSRLVPGDIDFWPGPGPRSIDLPGYGRVGVQVCYEIIFSGHVVDPENRPRFVFNPSNDAWFGAWGPPQHLAQARLRAAEEGLPVIRATPTGISAIIDAKGRIVASLPWREAGIIDKMLPEALPPTLFASAGNLLPCMFGLILIVAATWVRRRVR